MKSLARLLLLLILLSGAGCQALQKVGQIPVEMYNYFTGNTAGRAARRMEDPAFPDERRQGINYLVARDYGQREPYTDRYRQIATLDTDYVVRAIAIRALNRSRDAEATAIFIGALRDPSPLVRLEAAKALANVPDPAGVDALIEVFSNPEEDPDVRIAAADALRHHERVEVARALINGLNDRNFGIAWQAHQSLTALTGQDHKYDEAAWLTYLTATEKPFG